MVWRKCGKPNCECAQPGHRGHGPQYNLTRRAGNKTVNVHLRPSPELEKARREVAEHQRFASLVEEVRAVSEAAPPGRWPARRLPLRRRGKGGLGHDIEEIAAAEVGKLAALAAAGARLLEAVLAGNDDGHAGPHVKCGNGHQADYAGRPRSWPQCSARCR